MTEDEVGDAHAEAWVIEEDGGDLGLPRRTGFVEGARAVEEHLHLVGEGVRRRVSRGSLARVVFCASSRLRVSAEVLTDEASAALYVFKGKPSARALLERVEQVAAAST
jgi:hypothetical protein